jgi:MATE family multidrug resistance protein
MMTAKVEVLRVPAAQHLPGNVAEVAWLAYPVVLQTLSDTLMHVVDSAIVGRLGVTELGAVGFGGIWLWTMLTCFVGMGTGVQTFVAQAFGAGDRTACGRWAWYGLYVLVPVSVAWTAILSFGFEPLLRVLGGSGEMSTLATDYGRARLFGVPAVVGSVALASFFRGLGDTRTPLLVTVVANACNTVLTYGLVFGRWGLPAWGVSGAGFATALSQWLFLAIVGIFFFRRRVRTEFATRPPRPDTRAMRRFVSTSAPIGGQWLLDMISFAVFSTVIARMGDVQMAASQAMIQLLSLSFMQAYGISIAAGALVGRYIGARDIAAAERSHRSALKLGLALAALVAVVFLMAPEALLAIFTSDPEVLALGRTLLALGAVFQVIDAVGIIAGGSLRGSGDTRWPFAVQATLAWVLRLPLVYVTAVVLHGGVIGAWLGELGYVAALGAAWLLRWRGGAWRTVRI